MKYNASKTPFYFLEELARRHQTIRKQAGLSQAELAERSGVSFGSIKRFEQTGQISLESLLKSALILNRLNDFDFLFKPDENLKDIEKLFSNKTRKR